MTEFFTSGHAADLILLILAAELAWLIMARKLDALSAIGLVVPGILIVAALRAALTGAAWPWIALPLALSFPIHLMDLGRRIKARRPHG